MSKYLNDIFKKVSNLEHSLSILNWDLETNISKKGIPARAEAIAELEGIIHQTLTNPNVLNEILNEKSKKLSNHEQAKLREAERKVRSYALVPNKLVTQLSLTTNRCLVSWKEARPQNDWKTFAPALEEVVNLSIEKALCLNNENPYQGLIELYDPGYSTQKIDHLFLPLKKNLPPLIEKIRDKQRLQKKVRQNFKVPTEKQKRLALELACLFGLDLQASSLATSAHPFCGGVPTDVRITNRYNESDIISGVLGIIHETGHACYDQNLPSEFHFHPLGNYRSMSIHESQSLFYEMQIARSEEMLHYLLPLFAKHLDTENQHLHFFNKDNILSLFHEVIPGKIRVDADEATYPLHIILRYELEKDLISKKITVSDIPDIWSDKMNLYLNIDTRGDFKDGPMQDIHWASGEFGYFPSYALGALTAAQLSETIKEHIPEYNNLLWGGDINPIKKWLKDNIWCHGSLYTTDQLLINATNSPLDGAFFLKHLKNRYCK